MSGGNYGQVTSTYTYLFLSYSVFVFQRSCKTTDKYV